MSMTILRILGSEWLVTHQSWDRYIQHAILSAKGNKEMCHDHIFCIIYLQS